MLRRHLRSVCSAALHAALATHPPRAPPASLAACQEAAVGCQTARHYLQQQEAQPLGGYTLPVAQLFPRGRQAAQRWHDPPIRCWLQLSPQGLMLSNADLAAWEEHMRAARVDAHCQWLGMLSHLARGGAAALDDCVHVTSWRLQR